MTQQSQCVLCEHDCLRTTDGMRDIHHYTCPSCGTFFVTRETLEDRDLGGLTKADRMHIAACAREMNLRGLPDLCLFTDTPRPSAQPGSHSVRDVLENIFPNRVPDRFDRVLLNLCRLSEYPGATVRISLATDLPIVMAESQETVHFTLSEMASLGYLRLCNADHRLSGGGLQVIVLGKGLERAEQLGGSVGREGTKQAFIAMWFDDQTASAYSDGLLPAVKRCGFTGMRIDSKETNNKICDEIVAEIKRSRFLVADVTGHRQGVYFEAGYAMGLGIPVIWTCREDDKDGLHFDTRQYAHIIWEDPSDLQDRLAKRIAATIPGAMYKPG